MLKVSGVRKNSCHWKVFSGNELWRVKWRALYRRPTGCLDCLVPLFILFFSGSGFILVFVVLYFAGQVPPVEGCGSKFLQGFVSLTGSRPAIFFVPAFDSVAFWSEWICSNEQIVAGMHPARAKVLWMTHQIKLMKLDVIYRYPATFCESIGKTCLTIAFGLNRKFNGSNTF